jgi:phosphatidylglycerophosphate synthase
VLTLANHLTILRILMTPVITVLLLYRHIGAALALFLLAGITTAWTGWWPGPGSRRRRWEWSWTP